MTKTENAKRRIAEEIARGLYAPGEKLPTRHELMAELGLARASVDKVVRELCREGVLVTVKGAGTYVAGGAGGAASLNIFVVLNTEVVCLQSQFMERTWNSAVNAAGLQRNITVFGNHELERFLPLIRRDRTARIVWNRPALSSYALIKELQKAGYVQVLINRAVPEYNYFATDTMAGMDGAFRALKAASPDAVVGILPPFLNPTQFYLSEREVCFYESGTKHGFKLVAGPRKETMDQSGIMKSVSGALNMNVDVYFIPDFYMTPYIIAAIDGRGMRLGRDVNLITSDWNEAPNDTPGLICIQQKWDTLFHRTLEWITQEHPKPVQEKLSPDVTVNPTA